jgi:peptidoglycan L-alanyl-D-glutamate endopeptidase CwlK
VIISRNKDLLCPAFASRLMIFEQRLQQANLLFYLFQGLRLPEDQEELYAQGRTKPGKIVTNARGLPIPDSLHCMGLAADYVLDGMPDKPGLQWSWDLKADLNHDGKSDWQLMAEIAKDCGMEPGYFWPKFPDAPHIQTTFGMRLADIKELYSRGGIKRVWAECKG